jgi:hypothetical protein
MLIPPKNEAKMIMPAKTYSAMRGGEPTEFAALYRIEFWKMDLGAFTARG